MIILAKIIFLVVIATLLLGITHLLNYVFDEPFDSEWYAWMLALSYASTLFMQLKWLSTLKLHLC